MTNPDDVFDPLLTTAFRQQLTDKIAKKGFSKLSARDLFYFLNQSGIKSQILPQAFDFIQRNLAQVKQNYSHSLIKKYDEDKLISLQVPANIPFDSNPGTREKQKLLLKQTAAIQLTQPQWLQNIPQTFSSQSQVSLQVLAIYRGLAGIEYGKVDLCLSYRSLLLDMGNQAPVLHGYSYCQQLGLIPEVINFSSLQLAFSLFPRVFFAEILGFTFACCQMPSLFESCFPDHQLDSSFFKRRQNIIKLQRLPAELCISSYLELFLEQKHSLWHRVQQGFWLYHQQMQQCKNQLEKVLQDSKPYSLAMAELINNKAKAAIGHHQKILLQGKPLDSWFAGIKDNSTEFLDALKQSKYVDLKKPDNSLLLTLFDFQGPMFGVADENEIAIIKNWLHHGLNDQPVTLIEEVEKPIVIDGFEKQFESENNFSTLNNRALYFYLVNADLYPDSLPVARCKVRKWLTICGILNSLPFKHYSHQRFDRYITELYQHEMHAYKPLQGEPKISKAAYLWGLEQIAPMILIDGCWLQNSLDLQHNYPSISEKLFSIYCDELGNGLVEQNHPYIFQQLLNSLSIHVPAVDTAEFVEHPGFINSAFDLPVYMLSLANHSIEFLPELLGLNMAIELSGLGRHYMRLVDDWNYWEINPKIANIHISIDNIASGHTFLAKKAIQNYMDEIMQKTASHELVDHQWRRVYTGYSSLRLVAGRFKLLVPMGYVINKFKQKTG